MCDSSCGLGRAGRAGLAAVLVTGTLIVASASARANDFPTAARVDYVLGCMAANGNNRIALERCACAIDAIAEIMPFNRYERAETALRMQQVAGPTTGLFRDPPEVRATLDALRAAQAEANLRCGGA